MPEPRSARFMSRQKLTKDLAISILARDGVAAIWKLHEAAADAHRTGHPRSSAAILEIAEAAEGAWMSARERLAERLIAVGSIERSYLT